MASAFFKRCPVVVRGGGDLASGVIYKLHRAGFPVSVTELAAPKFVRRGAAYGEAVYSGQVTLEGVTAVLAENARYHENNVRVYVGYDLKQIQRDLKPVIIVDARMDKHNPDTALTDAPLVIALGPGYTAGVDCHVVIETLRGHFLGRVIEHGSAENDTGEPDAVQGITHARVLRAPAAGHVVPALMTLENETRPIAIGDMLAKDQPFAYLNAMPLLAPFAGVLRGLIHEQVLVTSGMKIGDIDPRGKREFCFTLSDKARAIGGGVLEAVLASAVIRRYL